MQERMYFIQSRTCEFRFGYLGKRINWFVRIALGIYSIPILDNKDRSDKIHSY